MRGKNRKSIASIGKLPQFTIMNVIDGQAGLAIYASLIFYSLTTDNILNIIVLLILAGISIMMLTGDNGILNRAAEAKELTGTAQIEEQVRLAALEALTQDLGKIKDTTTIDTALKNSVGSGNYTLTGEPETGWKVVAGEKEYTIFPDGGVSLSLPAGSGTFPYLPGSDFKQVADTNLGNGLVITDAAGNEYVWIEVPNDGSGPDYTGITDKSQHNEIQTALQEYVADYRKGAASQNYNWIDVWYAVDSSNTLINENTEGLSEEQKQLNNGCGLTYYEYIELREKMLESIYTNGGFWIRKIRGRR